MCKIEGEVRQTLFYNEENHYAVIKVSIIDTDCKEIIYGEPTMTICGFFPRFDKEERVRFFGNLKEHPKYGLQFDADRFERSFDYSKEGLIDYLSSDLFPGIGVKTAESIVETLGTNCIHDILNQPNILDDVPKMNDKKKQILVKTLHDNRQMETSLVWLYGFQISPKMAMKIIEHFHALSIDIIKDNPYVLMEEIEGIGFKRADEIALRIGFEKTHPYRIRAIVLYLIGEYMNKFGDTVISKSDLLDFTLTYLNNQENDVSKDAVSEQLDYLCEEGKIVLEGDELSLSFLDYAERAIATNLRSFVDKSDNSHPKDVVDALINELEAFQSIQYTDEQRKAIHTAIRSQFTIVTGGPGTGKTTVVSGIVQSYQRLFGIRRVIRLAAPTGKAAKRLQEATLQDATTIHKLLGYDFDGNFAYDKNHHIDADLIIIDEVSMLDVILASQLFQSLKASTKVVLVGDENQLPSVGPGQVLLDLIQSDLFDVVRLKQIHRQSVDSGIISLAYDVLNQQVSPYSFTEDKDTVFERVNDTLVAETIVKTIRHYMKQGYSLQDDIQVLVPIYKGMNGIDRLNSLIQERFNHHNSELKITYKEKTFQFQDKVMQLANQPEDGIMNGDIGFVSGIIEDKELIVNFSGNLVRYNVKDFDNLTLAYAISIHKSQGSEFPVVIVPFVRSYWMMLKRKLIYTAITRAKAHLHLLGDSYALQNGVNQLEVPRKTKLCRLLSVSTTQEEAHHLTIEDFMDE